MAFEKRKTPDLWRYIKKSHYADISASPCCIDEMHEEVQTRLQITITINMRTHSRRKNHYEKIPLSIYIILVLYYRDKPYIITHPKTDRAKYL